MKTPILDFINKYNEEDITRLHMPGHKGKGSFGYESFDITEFDGADSLYSANGIIKESEENASLLFDSGATFYSCEGSSLSVRAMCYLALAHALAKGQGERPWALAGKNAHASFLSASVLLDFDIKWLHSENGGYLSGDISPKEIEKVLSRVDNLPFCVYITSPDYLGNVTDISSISRVCKKYGVMLLVDNAHGAYLKLLGKNIHPLDLGATMCCDSAHKTLPVLTGGGYLHISKDAPSFFKENAKRALSLFGTSSPSYLILSSLDSANQYLATKKEELVTFAREIDRLKDSLVRNGYELVGNEPLKITILAKKYGYLGSELYSILYKNGLVCEFYDKDYLVMMLTPKNSKDALDKIKNVLLSIPKKEEILDTPPTFSSCKQVLSPRDAFMSASEEINVENALGRIMAGLSISCPPAVAVVASGEEINEGAIKMLKYYGIDKCRVVK